MYKMESGEKSNLAISFLTIFNRFDTKAPSSPKFDKFSETRNNELKTIIMFKKKKDIECKLLDKQLPTISFHPSSVKVTRFHRSSSFQAPTFSIYKDP